MEKLRYKIRSVIYEKDSFGNVVEREVFTLKTVSNNENGMELIKNEAYNGEYEVVEVEEKVKPLTLAERISSLEKAINVQPFEVGKWYYRGDRVSFNDNVYKCVAPSGVVCVWSPVDYPQYWEVEK